ncbi:GGDEF domain-containing protein [Bacillus sp. HMF5848]|uniref:GGDEF domain-containing protein n=1 Tax=Bacillus sp. HMF5848 TaxID=2495421 RepID=UPI000F77C6B6|nr:GGDEF domain-containing protein [Bacillus sp. HMF5848]RSK26827.1 GGDEF domain-containing protein [Bacillus sp. HMF5848]
MTTHIGEIVENVPVITSSVKSFEVSHTFDKDSNIDGIVVVDNDYPVGLVMRTHFFEKLSTRYGFDVFMGRRIDLIMDKNPLVVDFYMPITDVSRLAMERAQKHLYDFVIVTLNNQYKGTISIRNLLIKFAETQISAAKYASPLTGLPGNLLIEQNLNNVLNSDSPFSILYIDLDKFKAYNDTFGFQKGDKLIKETANIICKNISLHEQDGAFVGHIGGDDFIALINHHNYKSLCESIILDFDNVVKSLYDESPAISIDEQSSTVAISIAVITNKQQIFTTLDMISETAANVKKICKSKFKSCYHGNESILESL